jgi:hypothetical protein
MANSHEEEIIEVMARLDGDPYFTRLIMWYRAEYQRICNCMVETEDDLQLRWLQGRAQCYKRMIEQTETAKDDARKIYEMHKNKRERAPRNGTPMSVIP